MNIYLYYYLVLYAFGGMLRELNLIHMNLKLFRRQAILFLVISL